MSVQQPRQLTECRKQAEKQTWNTHGCKCNKEFSKAETNTHDTRKKTRQTKEWENNIEKHTENDYKHAPSCKYKKNMRRQAKKAKLVGKKQL